MNARRVLESIRMVAVWVVVLAGAFVLAGGTSIGRTATPAQITDVAELTAAEVATDEPSVVAVPDRPPVTATTIATTTTTTSVAPVADQAQPAADRDTNGTPSELDDPGGASEPVCVDETAALTGRC